MRRLSVVLAVLFATQAVAAPPTSRSWLSGLGVGLIGAGLGLVSLGAALGLLQTPLPLPLWLLLVVGVDVAHVHSTWLRTYFDPRELARHPLRYAAVPLGAYFVGVLLHAFGSLVFWRVLAYYAVFHFIRQQYGWVALYGRKEQDRSGLDRGLDALAVYAATLWPLLWWHAHLPRRFSWFVAGDFAGPVTTAIAQWTYPVYLALLGAFAIRQVHRWWSGSFFPIGKSLIVAMTALSWWLAIVALDSDWAFTALNVLPHGVPYMALVWVQTRKEGGGAGLRGRLLHAGFWAFLLLLLALAIGEEWLWDLGIWHDHPDFFGQGWDFGPTAQAFLVPLLALPQAVHYILDGFIWRSGERVV
jgi:hypothetical protein